MGGLLSTPSTNPSDSQSQHTTAMSSSKYSPKQAEKEAPESKTLEPQTPVEQVSNLSMDDPKTLEDQAPINTKQGDQEEEEEEEEEGECGFCLFMKGGGCRDNFVAWEKCIEEAEKKKEDIVDKCFEVTGALKKCMEAHPDYYAPILRAEKAAEEEAVRELEKEKAKESASALSSSAGLEERSSSREEEESKVSENK
ncbi:hypothetical protein LOK49_LG03G00705 [Camellia lanceoleosa]|uniref:Uncharacterized protein n=1 Tax=Camellia lanceoleosa TaxID=1840588 RepID=A0ACC0IAW4_9ERIC|nr:hypothetical protein LOK49_LG03G00705 [Camellia lanceoleosa]